MVLEEAPSGDHPSPQSSTSSQQLVTSTTDSMSESGTSSSGGGPPPVSPKRSMSHGRAPDMQMGKCKWIRVYDNVTYIVVGVVLREHEGHIQMLLIQEAKKKCRGKWYMPAGHVEPGETIEDGVKREMREETGLEASVEHLLCMEVKGSGWYRMAYSCEITGGALKTEPDLESLSAEWFNVDDIKSGKVNLRGTDFFRILNEALRFRQWKSSSVSRPFPPIRNRNSVQKGLFIEFVIVKESSVTGRLEVMTHHSIEREDQLLDDHEGFPTVEFGFEFFFPMVVSKCYRHLLEDGQNILDLPCAVLGTWCWPESVDSIHHGLRVRILCLHKKSAKSAPILDPKRYHWIELGSAEVKDKLGLNPTQYRVPLFLL